MCPQEARGPLAGTNVYIHVLAHGFKFFGYRKAHAKNKKIVQRMVAEYNDAVGVSVLIAHA